MKNARIVENFEGYLDKNPGIHPILTGTFDPAHMRHMAPLLLSQEKLLKMGIDNPYILLPHSRNASKSPEASLPERRRWLMETVDFFAYEIAHRVRICVGMGDKDQPYLYDLPAELQLRLLRIAGSDKIHAVKDSHIRTIFVQREIDMSSTRVKELMRQTGSHPDLHVALAPTVLADIREKGYYGKH